MQNLNFLELPIIIGLLAVVIWPFWRIFKKARFSGALGILMMVPLLSLVMIFFLAFAEWPNQKDKTAK